MTSILTSSLVTIQGEIYDIESESNNDIERVIKRSTLASIEQDVQDLKEKKLRGDFDLREAKAEFNETLFQLAKKLYELREEQTTLGSNLSSIEQLNNQLHELNPHIPNLFQLVDSFGQEALQDTLQATVSSLCFQVNQTNLFHDCHLFDCNLIEMQTIYVQRMIKARRAGLSLSTLATIENKWREMLTKKQQTAEEKKIGEHYVIFIPSPNSEEVKVLIKKEFIKAGCFKAAFLVLAFFAIERNDREGEELVVLQPKSLVEHQITHFEKQSRRANLTQSMGFSPEDTLHTEKNSQALKNSQPLMIRHGAHVIPRSFEALDMLDPIILGEQTTSFSPIQHRSRSTAEEIDIPSSTSNLSPTTQSSPPPLKVTQQPNRMIAQKNKLYKVASDLALVTEQDERNAKEQEQEKYRKEANLCLEIGGLPGIWPTYRVIEINGDSTLIQKAAGYTIVPLGSYEEKLVIELADMCALAKRNCLDLAQQIIYLRMIGEFLIGVKNLHKKGIIHRDIKPANVLCDRDGHAAITDFGVACREKLVDEQGFPLPNLDKQVIIGTPLYMCPEIVSQALAGERADWDKITTQADIWSIGIILWELLSGKESYSHPAIGGIKEIMPIVYQLIQLSEEPTQYHQKFPEPSNPNCLLHLIWSCTRINPTERPDAEKLVTRYHQWANEVRQKLEAREFNSIYDAFIKELEMFA